MIPKDYEFCVSCRALDRDDLTYIQTDYDLEFWLEFVGLSKKYRKDITGAIVKVGYGDLIAIWLSESGRPYDLSSDYYALPYYRPRYWRKSKLPYYWREENPEYSIKG